MSDDAEAFVDCVRNHVGDALRDVWAFDEESERCLYIRPDVADRLDGHDPSRYIDNERYGYVTRRTYDDLTYASFQYTVRGFDEFTTFRTFLEGFGVLASVDSDAEVAFDELFAALRESTYEFRGDADYRDGSPATADD